MKLGKQFYIFGLAAMLGTGCNSRDDEYIDIEKFTAECISGEVTKEEYTPGGFARLPQCYLTVKCDDGKTRLYEFNKELAERAHLFYDVSSRVSFQKSWRRVEIIE